MLALIMLISVVVAIVLWIWLITASGKRRNGEEGRSCWGWILTYLLMSLPIVNLVMLFVWSFGGGAGKDFTFRNWARLNLITILFCTIIVLGYIATIIVSALQLE